MPPSRPPPRSTTKYSRSWSAPSGTTPSLCSTSREPWSAGTRAPSASPATAPKRSSGSRSPSSIRGTASRRSSPSMNSSSRPVMAASRMRIGASGRMDRASGPTSSSLRSITPTASPSALPRSPATSPGAVRTKREPGSGPRPTPPRPRRKSWRRSGPCRVASPTRSTTA